MGGVKTAMEYMAAIVILLLIAITGGDEGGLDDE